MLSRDISNFKNLNCYITLKNRQLNLILSTSVSGRSAIAPRAAKTAEFPALRHFKEESRTDGDGGAFNASPLPVNMMFKTTMMETMLENMVSSVCQLFLRRKFSYKSAFSRYSVLRGWRLEFLSQVYPGHAWSFQCWLPPLSRRFVLCCEFLLCKFQLSKFFFSCNPIHKCFYREPKLPPPTPSPKSVIVRAYPSMRRLP